MAPFDWPKFLAYHRVPFVTHGPNVGRDEIAVKCPLCGENDPSHHMGISLSGRGWSCLRNHAHSGKSRARLIKLLLRCSDEEARRLAGYSEFDVRIEDYSTRTTLLRNGNRASDRTAPLRLPPSFRSLLDGSPMAEPFIRYLAGRGYGPAELQWIVREFDLRYTVAGPFAWRIIIPVCDRYGRLVTWQGRVISSNNPAKYKTLTTHMEGGVGGGSVAIKSTSEMLLALPALWAARNARALVICEGAMDAIRLSLYGRPLGVYATCVFGLRISDSQVQELEALRERFSRMWLCIDRHEAAMPSVREPIMRQLASVGVRLLELPYGVKDPGELSPSQALALCARAAD